MEIIGNMDGSLTAITRAATGRLCIAEGDSVYQASANAARMARISEFNAMTAAHCREISAAIAAVMEAAL